MAVFILKTHYASGRIICHLYYSSSIKTGTRRIMRLNELSSVVRTSLKTKNRTQFV